MVIEIDDCCWGCNAASRCRCADDALEGSLGGSGSGSGISAEVPAVGTSTPFQGSLQARQGRERNT